MSAVFRGDIYVVGTTNKLSRDKAVGNEKNILIAKYNKSGGKKWTKQ